MRSICTLLIALFACAGTARAAEPAPFDYWVLSLSWSPQYCAERERDPQCLRDFAFVVHGLWPQYEHGFPDSCMDVDRVSRDLVDRMLAIMPSPSLIQHEWKKHGSCSGMDVNDYFLTIERLHRSLTIPAPYQDAREYLSTTVQEIKSNFIKSNPGLGKDKMALFCSGRYLKEVRICYDKSFKPRDCSGEIQDHCGKQVVLQPAR